MGQRVNMLELDDAEHPVIDRRHEIRHRSALAIVERATTGKTAKPGWGVPHRLDRRAGELRSIGLGDHHARDTEVEVLEDNLAIIFANAHERRDISSFGGQDHGIGVVRADAAVLGVKECEIESSQSDDLDHVRGGHGNEDADCGTPCPQRLFDRVVQSHRSPQARIPRVVLSNLRSISAALILAKPRSKRDHRGPNRRRNGSTIGRADRVVGRREPEGPSRTASARLSHNNPIVKPHFGSRSLAYRTSDPRASSACCKRLARSHAPGQFLKKSCAWRWNPGRSRNCSPREAKSIRQASSRASFERGSASSILGIRPTRDSLPKFQVALRFSTFAAS